ncbi:MAG: DUF3800 domain-containing protein [Candidatus Binatus sp.]|uniref:DUF3800 domain-containing protein n=1 Tax=Candidatus Binatus sp. TaxID=2811406 RepID=UPI003C767A35
MSSGWSWDERNYTARRAQAERLAELLDPFGTKVRMLAMLDLRAYLDESGTDANSRVLVVGGYLAPADDWNVLEARWLDVLKTRNAPYYHATDAEAMMPGGPYEGWSVEQARELTDSLVSVIEPIHALKAVAVHVATEHWLEATEIIKPYLTEKEVKKFPKQLYNIPFQILAKSCIDAMLDFLRSDLPTHETVAFIFEDNDFKHATLRARDDVKRTHIHRARIGSIGFEGKQKFAGLQAADLLVWSYRRVTELRRGDKIGSIHRSLTSLVNADGRYRQVTREQLFDRVNDGIGRVLRGEVEL